MDFCSSVCNVREQIALHYLFCFLFVKTRKMIQNIKNYENENLILYSFLQIRIQVN